MSEEQVIFDKQNGIMVIAVNGSLDLAIIPPIKEKIDEHLNEENKEIIVDISNVSYTDSSGIGLMIYIAKTVFSYQGAVKFIIPSGFVFDVLHMVHFDRLFEVYKTRAKALEDFSNA